MFSYRRQKTWCIHADRVRISSWPTTIRFFPTLANPSALMGIPHIPLRVHLQCPFRHGVLTDEMKAYNASMSTVRSSVEWLFGDIINYFKSLDFKKNLKIGLTSVGKMYIVSALLQNALTCLYGNQTSSFFDLEPPTLEEYFSWMKNLSLIDIYQCKLTN